MATLDQPESSLAKHLAIGPAAIAMLALAATACLMVALLIVPVALPIGAMYWDVNVYIDAAHRINLGQVPSVDFFAPVGALGYYLATAFFNLFPNGQPVLITSWSIAVVTLPLMAAVCWEVGRRDGWTALLLAVPFIIFALLPFNTTPAYSFPGADGFGIYNRQTSQLLYCLVAMVLFVRNQTLLAILVGLAMTALFFLKVTGFLAGGLICLLALLAGRIAWRPAFASVTLFAMIVGAAQLLTGGKVTAYVNDIITLVAMNTEALAPRMLQAASKTFATSAATAGLGLVLVWTTWKAIVSALSMRKVSEIFDHSAVWLAVVLAAGLFFESQNTGSQELIFLWPVVIMVVMKLTEPGPRPVAPALTLVLAAAVVLPMTSATIQAAARTVVGGLKQERLEHVNLGQMGQVRTRYKMHKRAEVMRTLYQRYPEFQNDLVAEAELPSFQLYSDFDFQILLLKNIDDTVSALKAHEAAGLDYDTVLTLNFTNPFPWLLDKDAPKHVAIGADPNRAVPPMDAAKRDAVADTDIILIPTCPYAHNAFLLAEIYAPALTEHRRVTVSQCHDALVHPRVSYEF